MPRPHTSEPFYMQRENESNADYLARCETSVNPAYKSQVPNQQEMIALESLIDRYGVSEIVAAVAVICTDKAGHIRENWQDRKLAATWDKDSDKIGNVVNKLEN